MTRVQRLQSFTNKIVANSNTPEALTATSQKVKSVVVQALATNTDFAYLGTSSNQEFALAPGKSLTIQGDALDYGSHAMIDISEIFIRVAVSGNGVSYMVLDGI